VYVIGLDAHTRYVVLVVINRMGERILGPTRVRVEHRAQLLAVLAPFRPAEVVMETSGSWPWLHAVLEEAGLTFVLAHARRLRAIAEATYKRDDIDAELLARMRLAGLIPQVYATPAAQREWATLLRHRAALVALRSAAANRVHAQLHAHGLHLARGRLLTAAGWRYVRETAWPRLSGEERALVRTHRRLIAELRPMIRALEHHITAVAATLPEARRLMTVPGIGAVRALVLCAEATPVTRFPTPGHLASYAGLVPRSKQSGERAVRHGPIPPGANRWLRGALVRAVVSHVRAAPDSWLTQYYVTQKARVGWPTARVAAARKLARAVHAMLRTESAWVADGSTLARGQLQETHAAASPGTLVPRAPTA
jgi:transposase